MQDREPTAETGTATRRRFLETAAATGATVGLAGCIYGSGGTAAGTVVQFAADSGAYEAQADINKALHDAGLSKDISVEVLAGQSDTAQSQFSQWLSAGLEQPSLLRMDSGWTIPFILRDQVANLSEALPDVAKTVQDEYFDATVSTVTGPDGDVFGVPLFSDFGLMLYRKDLVEQAGFDPSGWATSPLSWQRFARITDETKRNADTDYGFTFQGMVYEGLSCCTFTEFMTTHGGSYFGARENLIGHVDERPVTVDAEPVLQANRMVRTFIHGPDDPHALDEFAGPISPTAVLSWSESPSLSAFTDGNAVMHRNWPYSVLSAGAKDAFGENLGVMPIPYGVRPGQAAVPGMGGSRSALGGWHVTLNPNAKHRDAALEVLKAMSADSFNLKLMEVLGYVPPKPGLLDTKEARNVPVAGRYVDTLKFAGQHAMPRPVSVVWPLESPRIAQKVSASFSGTQSPEQAMTDLAGLLTDIENSANQPPS